MAFGGRGVRKESFGVLQGSQQNQGSVSALLKVGLQLPSVTSCRWHSAELSPQELLCLAVACSGV